MEVYSSKTQYTIKLLAEIKKWSTIDAMHELAFDLFIYIEIMVLLLHTALSALIIKELKCMIIYSKKYIMY